MKETYWGYWLFLLGVFIIGVMLLTNNISTVNTQDYYNVKEVTQAAMIDAVDFSYYRLYGTIKMSEQKFVENFVRRFSEDVNMANTYNIGFYDLYEVPPKVSVRIETGSRAFNVANTRNDYDVVTTVNAILELGFDRSGDDSVVEKRNTSCKMYIYDKLWKYFKGDNVDGYTLAGDGISLSSEQIASLSKVTTLDGFKIWFNHEYKINGVEAKTYLAEQSKNKYKDLPDLIKNWHQRGWIDFK